jgi:hypothetical protein
MRLAPAIYQERIPGQEHLRALVLGDEIHAVSIHSEDLDWRGRLPENSGSHRSMTPLAPGWWMSSGAFG